MTLALSFGPTLSQAQDDLPPSGENNVWNEFNESDTAIVFVHGLLSDSSEAWAYDDEDDPSRDTNWPRLIREDPSFGDVSIFLGGYYTEIDSGDYDMRDAANELFTSLAISVEPAEDAVLDKSSIIFITHSTGGIVVRHMLVRNTEAFADKKVGLVLIASPSIGSRDADRFDFIAQFAKNKLGKQLQWNNPFLEELDKDFKNLVNERKIPGLLGAEWLEHHLLYARWLGIARDAVLVEPESAGRYFGEPFRLRDTDHISAVKPADRRHPAYRRLRFFYERTFLPAPHPEDQNEARGNTSTIISNKGFAVETKHADIPICNMIASERASIYREKSQTSGNIGQIEAGTIIEVLYQPDATVWVETVDKGGLSGFVLKRHMQPLDCGTW